MKLINVELEPLYNFLFSLELKGRESRMRTRFLNLLGSRIKEIGEFQSEMLDKHGEKDEMGKVKTEEKDGKLIYLLNNPEEYKNELRDLLIEEYIIDVTPERKDMLCTVRDIVLNTQISFSGQDALQYDRWCEIFEGIE